MCWVGMRLRLCVHSALLLDNTSCIGKVSAQVSKWEVKVSRFDEDHTAMGRGARVKISL